MRERTLDLNMQHYVCGPVREKSFQEMRSKTYQNRWAEKKKDLEKPEWYGTVEPQCITSTLGPEGVWYSEKFGVLKLILIHGILQYYSGFHCSEVPAAVATVFVARSLLQQLQCL